jgi:hypothetical protein
LNAEIAAALARFFEEGRGPSHHELDRLFNKHGLGQFDPRSEHPSDKTGKLKRIRIGLSDASEHSYRESEAFTKDLIALLRARGCFAPGDQFAGQPNIRQLRSALDHVGWRLSPSGELLPTVPLGSLQGSDLTEALTAYVGRIQRGAEDAPLTIGTAKDLVETAARHVMVEETGAYDRRVDFPTTLFKAAAQKGVGTPSGRMIDDLDQDPQRALEQALMLAALALNRLRRDEGAGHGRPHPSKASQRQGRIAAQVAALETTVLLPEVID